MRGAARRWHREDEEESSFVSMTDMTVSFLFIMMVLLAFFTTKLSDTETVPRRDYEQAIKERNEARAEVDRLKAEIEQLRARLRSPLEKYLSQLAEERSKLLEQLKKQLRAEFPELLVEISAEGDALRFQGEGLFKTDESILHEEQARIVGAVAARVDELLPCYTLGPLAHWEESCNAGAAIIEAVQIEGHTDSTGNDLNNLKLSTDRANATFAVMLTARPDLTQHWNYRQQPVLSVAGYGRWRPVADNSTVQGRATNRRIDLRIIMFTPASSEEIERIREKLRGGEGGLQ